MAAVQYSPDGGRPFRVLDNAQARMDEPRSNRPRAAGGADVSQKRSFHVQSEPGTTVPVRFGPDNRFALLDGGEQIVTRNGKKTERFPVPQTSRRDFRRLRPDVVKNTLPLDATKIKECVAVPRVVDGTLWFGKSFYDSEGLSGVGGFGYFDTNALKYRIYSPPEIWRWSTTAIQLWRRDR